MPPGSSIAAAETAISAAQIALDDPLLPCVWDDVTTGSCRARALDRSIIVVRILPAVGARKAKADLAGSSAKPELQDVDGKNPQRQVDATTQNLA